MIWNLRLQLCQTHCVFHHYIYNFDNSIATFIWRFWRQKQVTLAGISNCIPQNTVGCNCLSLPEIPVCGSKAIICEWHLQIGDVYFWHRKLTYIIKQYIKTQGLVLLFTKQQMTQARLCLPVFNYWAIVMYYESWCLFIQYFVWTMSVLLAPHKSCHVGDDYFWHRKLTYIIKQYIKIQGLVLLFTRQ